MSPSLLNIVNSIIAEGRDYSDFKILLEKINESKYEIDKDEIIDLVSTDSRIQLHTTPNLIARLICQVAKKGYPRSAIDICCGTGNILYYLQNILDDLTGVEISENVATLTKYLNPGMRIITADTFKYTFSQKYDLVVGNIPFGMQVEVDGKKSTGEEAFIEKAIDLLSEKGIAIILVPYTVLISDRFKQFRNEITSNLSEIISLPIKTIRNLSVKTAICVFELKSNESVWITQINNLVDPVEEYANARKTSISKNKFTDRWDPEYYLSKETEFYTKLEQIQTTPLNELSEIIQGRLITADRLLDQGSILYLKPGHLKQGRIIIDGKPKYVDICTLSQIESKCLLQKGDIVISTVLEELKMHIYHGGEIQAFASNNIAIIRSSKQDYIFSYLQTEEGQSIFKRQATDLRKGVVLPHVTLKDLGNIKIPILPISELNTLGNESIEKHSKVELLGYREQLKNLIPNEINKFNEPAIVYGGISLNNEGIWLNFILDRLNRIDNRLEVLDNKVDALIDTIRVLQSDFLNIQSLRRDDEEKIFRLYQKIDIKLREINTNHKITIDGYIEEIKRWLDLWEKLDVHSQKFLPIAEFIFDELSKIDDADFAPFVVQYCRSLENEILKKLFEAYYTSALVDVDREELVKDDLSNPKTGKFAKMVKNNSKTFTLGDMNFIMALLKQGGETLANSTLLQHFREFTIQYFDERIIEAKFLADINKLTNDYRNKAAHPSSIGIETAIECRKLLRKSLNIFLESIKNK